MIPSPQIELAQPADCAAVAACVHAAYAPYVARIGREPAPMLADYEALIRRGVAYVVRDTASAETVRGVLIMEPFDNALFIENVAVHPEHQHQGLGLRLMRFAEQQAAAKGLTELRLYTNERMTENIAFYQRLGYQEVERRTADGFRRVFMRKFLPRIR